MTWVKEPPYIPSRGLPSVHYWYYDIKEDTIWAAEIYYKCWRLYAYDGLWWDERIEPPEKPSLEKSRNVKGDTKRYTRRNRISDSTKPKKSS